LNRAWSPAPFTFPVLLASPATVVTLPAGEILSMIAFSRSATKRLPAGSNDQSPRSTDCRAVGVPDQPGKGGHGTCRVILRMAAFRESETRRLPGPSPR
jgi:hypothetical protein